MSNAQQVYQAVKDHLDGRKFRYTPHDEDLAITLTVHGDDIPIDTVIRVMEEREVVQVLCPMSWKAPEDKRIDLAVAVAAANYGIVNGSFDFDLSDGKIRFRLTQSFRGTTLNPEQVEYMLGVSFITTDEYNDKFFALCKDMMSLEDFLKKENEKRG